jgi:hypothetical protein
MRHINIALKNIIGFIFLSVMLVEGEITENTRFLRDAVQSGSSDKQSDSIY